MTFSASRACCESRRRKTHRPSWTHGSVQVADAQGEIRLARSRVAQLVHDGIGVEVRGFFTVGQVDERITDHVHALGKGARGAHGVEPILEAERDRGCR